MSEFWRSGGLEMDVALRACRPVHADNLPGFCASSEMCGLGQAELFPVDLAGRQHGSVRHAGFEQGLLVGGRTEG